MKYDSKKCNNLNFKLASGLSGFIKSAPNGDVYLYQYQNFCNWDPITMTMIPYFWKTVKAEAFNSFAEDSELSIVPRDPETYTDWKVGDRVMDKDTRGIHTIAAKLSDIVFLLNDNNAVTSTCTAMLTKDYTLVLTDYEQELLKVQGKKECPFKEEDKVLVRDEDSSWAFDEFLYYVAESHYPYKCVSSSYEQCIPLNEDTWKLLGTTDEYKEEE
ncbi:unknown [Bacteroides sp. CAG:709]|jgi:hypothetical protein|nr:unknown [Bacteroides sp. CAG:709]